MGLGCLTESEIKATNRHKKILLSQEVTIPLVVRWKRVKLPIRPLKRLTGQLQRAYETSTWTLVDSAIWGGLGVESCWRKHTTERL